MYEQKIRQLEVMIEGLDRQIQAAEKLSIPPVAEIAHLSEEKMTLISQLRDLRRWQRDYNDEFGDGYDE